jgi:hypothetical protein
LNAKGKKVFYFFSFFFIYYFICQNFWRELKGVDGLLLHLRHGRQSFLFFFFSSAAELLCTTSSSSQPSQPPLERIGVVGGGALRSFARPH